MSAMTKQEFLEKLRMALGGKLSAEQVQENVIFYEDYINTEIRKGKSEEEVLTMLGDPRLIARTIAETAGGRDGQSAEYAEGAGGNRYSGGNDVRREDESGRQVRNLSRVPSWVWLVLVLLIVVVVLSAVFSVISALLPVLLPILFVLLLVKVFRDWIH